MKKPATILLLVIILTMLFFVAASASHGTTAALVPGPFQGDFTGYLYGDKHSKAPVTLELRQIGDEVTGNIILGEGLLIEAGRCGQASIPAGSAVASGQTLANQPRSLQANTSFIVSGFTINGHLESELSTDGKEITAAAEIDLPWICGRDPVITAVVIRDEN